MGYPILYHYTTIDGLLGIIQKCELWSSNCRFLNDGSELSYARNMFFDEIKKLNLPDAEPGSGYRIPGKSLDDFQVFVTCFCEDSDLLSQWRGYGMRQGYSLGFDFNSFERPQELEILQVKYDIPDPNEYFAEELKNAHIISAHPGVVEEHVSKWILPRLAQVKHPSFSEEREWRILIQYMNYELKTLQNIRFRQSPLGPISYLINSFPKECLKEIVIGPGPYSTICQEAVANLIEIYQFEDVNIQISKIPFRT